MFKFYFNNFIYFNTNSYIKFDINDIKFCQNQDISCIGSENSTLLISSLFRKITAYPITFVQDPYTGIAIFDNNLLKLYNKYYLYFPKLNK